MRRAVRGVLMAAFAAVSLGWMASALFTQEPEAEPARVVIAIGSAGDDVVNRLGLPVRRSQTVDALLYDAGPESLGRPVLPVIEHAGRRTVLPEADSLLFYDGLAGYEGIQEINIRFALPPRPVGPQASREHDDAVRQAVGRVLNALGEQGWQRYIPLSSPRVAGRHSYDLPGSWWQGEVEASDPGYLPSLEEWQRLNHTPTWLWFDTGVFVQLSYYRGDASLGQPGGLRASVRTERLALRSYTAPALDDWAAVREGYALAIPGLLAQRRAAETRARASRVGILDDWRDPAVAGVTVPPT